MKVLVAELNQESNSFCPTRTTLEDFRRYGIKLGSEYRESVRGIGIESEGIFTALEEYGISYVPAIRMRAQAGAMTLPEVYNHFVENVDRVIREQGPFDGAVFSLHGASQSTERWKLYPSDNTMVLDDDYVRSGKGKNLLRTRLEVSWDKKRALFTPYANVEFYNSLAIEKIRYTVGTDIRLNKQHGLGVYYRYQQMHNVDADDYDPDMHYLGVSYKFKF